MFLAAAAAIVLPAASAQAVTITFEGHSNAIYESGPINRSGFLIGNPVGQEQHFHELDSTVYNTPNNGTGILANDRNTDIFVKDAGSTVFTLGSVDVGSYSASSLAITGYRNGNVTNVINVALGSSFATVSGAALGTVDRIVFDGIGGDGGFVLDNLTLSAGAAVPEPATWAMMIAGFGLAGVATRRRTRIAFA